jgi:hypothetical protein
MILRALPVIVLVACPAAGAEALVIDHTPVACMVVGRYPEIAARLVPSQTVAKARVYFRADNAPNWSSVEMRVEGDVLKVALLKPRSHSRGVYYYIEVTDLSKGVTRSTEYLSEVVLKPDLCPDPQGVARPIDSASPVVEKGPAVALTQSKDSGGKTNAILLGTLGAAAAGAGVVALTHHSAVGPPSPIPDGVYSGPLTGFTQLTEADCIFALTANTGTISIIVTGSTATATFAFPTESLSFDGSTTGAACPSPTLGPAPAGQIPSLTVSGLGISGMTIIGSEIFGFQATLVQGGLQGAISVLGGPAGFSWSTGTATFRATPPSS